MAFKAHPAPPELNKHTDARTPDSVPLSQHIEASGANAGSCVCVDETPFTTLENTGRMVRGRKGQEVGLEEVVSQEPLGTTQRVRQATAVPCLLSRVRKWRG